LAEDAQDGDTRVRANPFSSHRLVDLHWRRPELVRWDDAAYWLDKLAVEKDGSWALEPDNGRFPDIKNWLVELGGEYGTPHLPRYTVLRRKPPSDRLAELRSLRTTARLLLADDGLGPQSLPGRALSRALLFIMSRIVELGNQTEMEFRSDPKNADTMLHEAGPRVEALARALGPGGGARGGLRGARGRPGRGRGAGHPPNPYSPQLHPPGGRAPGGQP
jgi:hypothetical protein